MQVKPSLAKYIAKDACISVKALRAGRTREKREASGSITVTTHEDFEDLALRCMLHTVLQTKGKL